MKEYTIDCARIDGPREFHFVLARQLDLPPWYGNNLDALHDVLTALTEETHLTFVNFPAFAAGFRRCMEDAQKANPLLRITICPR